MDRRPFPKKRSPSPAVAKSAAPVRASSPEVRTVQDLARQLRKSDEVHVRRMDHSDARLRSIEEKLDKVITMMQTDALEVVMNLSPDDSQRFRDALSGTASASGDKPAKKTKEAAAFDATSPRPSHRKGSPRGPASPWKPLVEHVEGSNPSSPTEAPAAETIFHGDQSYATSQVDETDDVSGQAEGFFPAWALAEIPELEGQWAAIGPAHPVRAGGIVKVVDTFATDDDTGIGSAKKFCLTRGLRCHILQVDSEGDVLLYCPTWKNLPDENNLPRWVTQRNFHRLQVCVTRSSAD
mmetsp:Transcript_123751/g.214521  ORF Transcript_123751/g.214521 Transcript_123751/m.214521 type:complete len:295 (-) Transcript_123751:159-1043(-)